MLDSLRKGAGSWAAKILLLLLAVSFGVWGIADVYTGFGRQSLASVGGRDISTREFERAYQNQLRAMSNRIGRQVTSDEIRALNFPEQVLRQLIGGSALDWHAARLRLGVTDDVIASQIRSEEGFQDSSGKFSRERFINVLQDNNLTEAAYVDDERRQAVRAQLLETMTAPAQTPQILIDAINRYQNETRVIKFVALPDTAAGDVPEPSDDQVKAFYESDKTKFTLPEYRKFAALAVTPAALTSKVEVSDEEIKTAYEARKDTFGTPEKRKIQQISFPDIAAAQAGREKLAARGADFVAIAKDLGFSATDIDLGLNAKSDLTDKKVAEAAFSLKKGEVSQPVDGALSLVVLRVTDVVPGFVKTFDDVKAELRESLALEKARTEVTKLVNTIEDRRAGGVGLAGISKDTGLPMTEVVSSLDGRTPEGAKAAGMPNAKNLLTEVFATEVGVEGPALEVEGDGTAWFDVLEIIPQRLKPLDEVKAEVAKLWRDAEVKSRLAQKARELIKNAKPGDNLAAIANTFNGILRTSQPIKRTGAEPGLPISAVALAFGLEKGAFGTASTASGGQVIVQVDAINPPAAFDAKQIEEARKELKQALSNDYAAQYITAIQSDAGVKINSKTLASITGQQ